MVSVVIEANGSHPRRSGRGDKAEVDSFYWRRQKTETADNVQTGSQKLLVPARFVSYFGGRGSLRGLRQLRLRHAMDTDGIWVDLVRYAVGGIAIVVAFRLLVWKRPEFVVKLRSGTIRFEGKFP